MPRHRLHPAPGAKPPKRAALPQPTPHELETRRKRMWNLVVMGGTSEDILHEMQNHHPGMSDQVVRKLHKEVRDALESNSRETIVMEREKQKRRLHGQIAQAMKDRDWSAVASLENTFSRVSGTASPITVNHNHNASPIFRSALERALIDMSETQAERLLRGEDVPLGAGEVIETTAEAVPAANGASNGASNGAH